MTFVNEYQETHRLDEVAEAGLNIRPVTPRLLQPVGLLFALKAGFALATLIAVAAGAEWGWIVPEGNVEAGFLGSGLLTVAAFCVCAVRVPTGSKAFYLFGLFLNVASFAVALVRGSIGLVGIVALVMSALMIGAMLVPETWKGVLKGARVAPRPGALAASFLLGAALLVPVFIAGGADGADRDGFVHGPIGGDISEPSFDAFLETVGADRGCLMGRMYFEFGSATLSSWDAAGPSADEIARIEQLAAEC